MTCNKLITCIFICAVIILCQAFVFAEDKPQDALSSMDKLMLEAQNMVSKEDMASYEELPTGESSNNGYWWIKQPLDEKKAYVKQLIITFELEDKKLSADKIVKEMDIVYNPVDNPIDIKMDKSVERIFNLIVKRMMVK
jgi:hypothetical protein